MSEIKGTIINIRDFLSIDEKKVVINGDKDSLVFTLAKGRAYHIPSFQREIRWGVENLSILIHDIKESHKFLGNFILAEKDDKNLDVIDGQQRISILLMICFYIKDKWGDKILDASNYTPCQLIVESFEKYEEFKNRRYDVLSLSKDEMESDWYNQSKEYFKLWKALGEIKELSTVDLAREFYKNLMRSTVNVILADRDSTDYNIDYFIDVNLKGVRLDTEDIFKGYLFHMSNTEKTLKDWQEIKRISTLYNKHAEEKTGEEKIYPLIIMLYHYFSSDLYVDNNYSGLEFGDDFCLKKNYENQTGRTYYKGEHLIKVINDDTYMHNSINSLIKIIELLDDIIYSDSPNNRYKDLFVKEGSDKVSNADIYIIFVLMRFILLDKQIKLPYALIIKYFLKIIKDDKKINNLYCKQFYSVFAFSVLFSFFTTKKEIGVIESALKRENWHDELMKKINQYFGEQEILERKVIMQCKYLEEDPEMVSDFKCKSLAIIYNYFKRSETGFKYKKGSGEELKEFLYNSDKYSVEHFIINESGKYNLVGTEEYEYPTDIKKYANSIFNYIFIPRQINNDVLKNKTIWGKIGCFNGCEDGKKYIAEVECNYSKMIIELVEKDLKEPLSKPKTKDGWDSYFAYAFKRDFKNFTQDVITNIAQKLKE